MRHIHCDSISKRSPIRDSYIADSRYLFRRSAGYTVADPRDIRSPEPVPSQRGVRT
ncbi:hypothetical protein I552_7374 [Mycobacterium xenopi 3993]|nr:hypothetical protein I552_7374 [Mycobacterium xenopi 3993]